MRIVIVSDFHYNQIPGGAESNDLCLELLLKEDHHNVRYFTSYQFNDNHSFLQNVDLFIFSNFYLLNQDSKKYVENLKYIIIEHDYKFVPSRNPFQYPNFIADPSHLVNQSFYKKAQKVIVQSKFQKEIFDKNLKLDNIYCFSGNLWFIDELKLMSQLNKIPKNNKYAILDSESRIKGKEVAERFCKENNYDYDLISDPNHNSFLKKMAQYSYFVFFPSSPETFSRTCLEAKMCGVEVITNDLVSVCKEDFYSLPSEEIIKIMVLKHYELIDFIKKL